MKIKPRDNLFTGWGGAISEWAGPLNLEWAGLYKKIAVSGPATQAQGLVFERSGCALGHPVPEVFWVQWKGFRGKGGLPCL